MPASRLPIFLRLSRQRFYYDIPLGRTLIGRLPRCHLVLGAGDVGVSREHAEIIRQDDRLEIRDLNSRNGTSINGKDIRGLGSVPLKIGDRIEICDFVATVTDERLPFDDSGICRVEIDDDSDSSGSFGNAPFPASSPASSSSHSVANISDTRLAALISLGKSIGNALQTDHLLETAANALLEIFPAADRCVIGFRSPTGDFEAKWWTMRSGHKDAEIRVSQRIFQHVVETAETVLFDDAMTQFDGAASVMAGSLRSVMCAPLTDPDGNVFGMVQSDSHAAHRFHREDLDIFATVTTQISLALNFSQLHLRTIEDAVIRSDIEQANAVQRQFLPAEPPSVPGYEFADYYSAARHIGGDYFDYIPLNDGRFAIVLGDVVGKGVPAALTMVKLATEVRTAFEVVSTAADAMTRLNKRLSDSFITGVIMVLDPVRHMLTIANAGHDSPVHKSKEGLVNKFGEQEAGFPISVVDDYEYQEATVSINAGDMLVVFSDGFIDAENTDGTERFGLHRVHQVITLHRGNATSLTRAIIDEIDQFTSGAPQFDDMCLVCFRRLEDS
jgi:serine phosphatase RsbU (regulator of sigma subunit)